MKITEYKSFDKMSMFSIPQAAKALGISDEFLYWMNRSVPIFLSCKLADAN